MKAIDVCAGAGGLSLGLLRAGFEVTGVERDPRAVETYRRNVGPCVEADITAWRPEGEAFLVAGGVPCQPWSNAGKRGGLADERGTLYLHLLRIAVEARASFVLFENVAGLTRWRHPTTQETALSILLEAFCTHDFAPAWRILDFAAYGLPQRRKRLVIVGVRDVTAGGSFAFPNPTHGEGLERWRTVRDALDLRGTFRTGRMERATTETGGKPRGWWQGGRYIDVDAPGYTVGTRNNADWIAPVDGGKPWRLGLRELALLQGFPPEFTFSGRSEDRHRQMGNAVPPLIGEIFGRAILSRP